MTRIRCARTWLTNMNMLANHIRVESLGQGNYLVYFHLYISGPWEFSIYAHADGFESLEQTLFVQVERLGSSEMYLFLCVVVHMSMVLVEVRMYQIGLDQQLMIVQSLLRRAIRQNTPLFPHHNHALSDDRHNL